MTHPRGRGGSALSALLLGERRSIDMTAGYPVHRVEVFKSWRNPHGVQFVDWRASCGATGTMSGPEPARGLFHSTLRGELCRDCWSAATS